MSVPWRCQGLEESAHIADIGNLPAIRASLWKARLLLYGEHGLLAIPS